MDAALAAFIDTLNSVDTVEDAQPEPVTIDGHPGRREAAETHRKNPEQWVRVTDETINEALQTPCHLDVLQEAGENRDWSSWPRGNGKRA